MNVLLFIAPLIVTLNATPLLELTLFTDRTQYWLGDYAQVFGYLYYNGSKVTDGIVSLEIDEQALPQNETVIFRTFTTGTPPTTQSITILSVTLTNEIGTPRSSIKRGNNAYFTTTVKNNDIANSININLTLTALDSASGIAGSTMQGFDLAANGTGTLTLPLYIQDKAATGNATIYANAFTNLPRDKGKALALEKSAKFTITDTVQTPPSSGIFIPPEPGEFATAFKVPVFQFGKSTIYNFTVYTASTYKGETVTAKKLIRFRVPDLNLDNTVNVQDLIVVAGQIGWTGPPGSIAQDLNSDGKVNILDLMIVARVIGWTKT